MNLDALKYHKTKIMKTINLYVDFEFTSLSPDAQSISLGIVSDPFDRSIKAGEQLPSLF